MPLHNQSNAALRKRQEEYNKAQANKKEADKALPEPDWSIASMGQLGTSVSAPRLHEMFEEEAKPKKGVLHLASLNFRLKKWSNLDLHEIRKNIFLIKQLPNLKTEETEEQLNTLK